MHISSGISVLDLCVGGHRTTKVGTQFLLLAVLIMF
jgi:hypothetical protein